MILDFAHDAADFSGTSDDPELGDDGHYAHYLRWFLFCTLRVFLWLPATAESGYISLLISTGISEAIHSWMRLCLRQYVTLFSLLTHCTHNGRLFNAYTQHVLSIASRVRFKG